jgi:hypothetical protein
MLQTCKVLSHPAGALLFDVRNCVEMRKSGPDIANLLHEVGKEIMSDRRLHEFGGWTLDNTKANCAAMRELALLVPEWVNVGCIAHGMNVVVRDFCKVVKSSGRGATTFGVEWMEDANERVNTIVTACKIPPLHAIFSFRNKFCME